MSRYEVSSRAQRDLDGIHDYIASDKALAADRWLEKTIERFSWLASNPECGQNRDEVFTGLRPFSHGNYVIYFRPGRTYLEIVRVLHGARDIEGLI
jgi:toxin ParE1/3/4